jgi:hypothetical protein
MVVSLRLVLICLLFQGLTISVRAHSDDEESSPNLVEPVAFGLPGSQVSLVEKGAKRIIESNGIPNHQPGAFPNPGNPNSIRPQSYHFEVPLHPVAGENITPLKAMDFGVALNGVKFDPGTAEFWHNNHSSIWNLEAIVRGHGILGMDWSNAHVQPSGAYHYHGIPKGLIQQLHGEGTMVRLGWAADGFPVYGPWAHKDPKSAGSPVVEMKSSYRLRSGTRPGGSNGPGGAYDGTYTPDFEYVADAGDLDECNGRFGVTPENPEGIYYYVITSEFPFIPRNFRGAPDPSFQHRPPPGFEPPGDYPTRRRLPPPPGGFPPPPPQSNPSPAAPTL